MTTGFSNALKPPSPQNLLLGEKGNLYRYSLPPRRSLTTTSGFAEKVTRVSPTRVRNNGDNDPLATNCRPLLPAASVRTPGSGPLTSLTAANVRIGVSPEWLRSAIFSEGGEDDE